MISSLIEGTKWTQNVFRLPLMKTRNRSVVLNCNFSVTFNHLSQISVKLYLTFYFFWLCCESVLWYINNLLFIILVYNLIAVILFYLQSKPVVPLIRKYNEGERKYIVSCSLLPQNPWDNGECNGNGELSRIFFCFGPVSYNAISSRKISFNSKKDFYV